MAGSYSNSPNNPRVPLGAKPFAGIKEGGPAATPPTTRAEPPRPFMPPGYRPKGAAPAERTETPAAAAPDATRAARERMAATLASVAERVRSGQIPVAPGSAIGDETALLAAVLASLLAARA